MPTWLVFVAGIVVGLHLDVLANRYLARTTKGE